MARSSCFRLRGSRRAVPGGGSCGSGRRVHRLHCGARSCGPSPNSLRLLRRATFKQAATSQFTNALRAGPHALRSSSLPKSPPPGTARRERNRLCSLPQTQKPVPQRCVRAGRGAPLRPSPDTDSPVDWLCLARGGATGPARPAQARGAQLWGRRACALQQLTRRGCLNEMSAANGVSSAARPQSEHRSEVGGTPPTASAKPSGLPGRAFAPLTVTRT